MSAGENDEPGPPTTSARELLEQFMYGHIAEVEKILRFAREH